MAGRLVPDMDIRNDEDLLRLLEGIRLVGITGHDEIDEVAGLIRMKIERYGRRQGMSRMRARFWGRQVARPLVRGADEMRQVAALARVCRNRFEAFLVALDDEGAQGNDFVVRGREKRRRAA